MNQQEEAMTVRPSSPMNLTCTTVSTATATNLTAPSTGVAGKTLTMIIIHEDGSAPSPGSGWTTIVGPDASNDYTLQIDSDPPRTIKGSGVGIYQRTTP